MALLPCAGLGVKPPQDHRRDLCLPTAHGMVGRAGPSGGDKGALALYLWGRNGPTFQTDTRLGERRRARAICIQEGKMETGKIEAIGGLFFRAKDTETLSAWYRTHLGIAIGGPWPMSEGPAVVSPMAEGTDYWAADKQWMLNLRVSGLDAVVERLAAAGIPAERRPDEWDHPEIGRFARIHDPEGNAIELWEPPGGAA